MKNWFAGLLICAALMMAGLFSAATPTLAQTPDAASKFTPARLPDGHPDMQGIWLKTDKGFDALHVGSLDGTNFATPRAPGGASGGSPAAPPQNGAAVAPGGPAPAAGGPPAGGGGFFGAKQPGFLRPGVPDLPYLPAADAIREDRFAHHVYDDPEAHCHIPGVPRDTEQPPYPIQIIQDQNYFTLLYEYVHEFRIISEHGGSHPKNYKAWDGDSRGHWEGDTFVVDTSNFNGETWLDMEANFVDANEHVVERYTMVGPDTIAFAATVDDPTVFTKPWTMHLTLRRVPAEEQLLEYSCVEGERDTQHYTEEEGGHAK